MRRIVGPLMAMLFSSSMTMTSAAVSTDDRAMSIAIRDALGVSDFDLQFLYPFPADDRPLLLELRLGGQAAAVELLPSPVFAPGAALHIIGDRGATSQAVPRIDTYRGNVIGRSGSFASATVDNDGVRAQITDRSEQRTYMVVPLSRLGLADIPGLHVVYVGEHISTGAAICGEGTVSRPDHVHLAAPTQALPPGGSLAMMVDPVCEMAVEADYEYFVKLGSSLLNVVDNIATKFNTMSAVYDSHFGMTFSVTTALIHTTSASDPYQGFVGDAAGLRQAFKEHWQSSHSDIHRDAAFLLTDKAVSGGYADLGTVCSCEGTYAVARVLGVSNTLLQDMLLAHEIGHTFGAMHCNGGSSCHIMCSIVGGCSGPALIFGNGSINQMQPLIDSGSCLYVAGPAAAPVITMITPANVQANGGALVTVTGLELDQVKRLTLVDAGNPPVTQGIDCGIDTISATQLQFTAPQAVNLGPVQVIAENAAGSSAGGTGTSYSQVAVDPPLVVAPATKLPGSNMLWKLWGQANAPAALLVAVNDSSTHDVQGFQVLTNATTTATPTLSSIGYGQYQRVLPMYPAGTKLHSQLLVYGSGSTLIGVSAVRVTTIN